MDEQQFQRLLEQLTQGNGSETEATRGLTLRELVLNHMSNFQAHVETFDRHRFQEVHPGAARRGEIYGVAATVLTLVIGYMAIFL